MMNNKVSVEKTRVMNLREYLIEIIDDLSENKDYQINANMLSNNPNNYSLDKIPVASTIERWIMGIEVHKDVYSFRSRMDYSQNTMDNLIMVFLKNLKRQYYLTTTRRNCQIFKE